MLIHSCDIISKFILFYNNTICKPWTPFITLSFWLHVKCSSVSHTYLHITLTGGCVITYLSRIKYFWLLLLTGCKKMHFRLLVTLTKRLILIPCIFALNWVLWLDVIRQVNTRVLSTQWNMISDCIKYRQDKCSRK